MKKELTFNEIVIEQCNLKLFKDIFGDIIYNNKIYDVIIEITPATDKEIYILFKVFNPDNNKQLAHSGLNIVKFINNSDEEMIGILGRVKEKLLREIKHNLERGNNDN